MLTGGRCSTTQPAAFRMRFNIQVTRLWWLGVTAFLARGFA